MYLRQKVDLYPKDTVSDTWITTSTTIVEARDIRVSKSLGRKKDTWSVKIRNPKGGAYNYFEGTDSFKIDDRVKIYFWANNTTASDNNLMIDGTIRTPSEMLDSGDISLRGNSMVDVLFRTQIWLSITTSTNTDAIIRDIIKETNRMQMLNLDSPRYIVGGEIEEWTNSSICDNPIVKSDGTPFPLQTISRKYTNAMELIQEVSGPDFTEDGAYYWFVDYLPSQDKWVLKWRFKSQSLTSGITEGTKEINFNVSKTAEEVIGAIICNLGDDLYGHFHEELVFNPSSAKIGMEIRYWTKTAEIIPTIVRDEINNDLDKSKFPYDTEGANIGKFPVAGAFPYTYTSIPKRNITTGEILKGEDLIAYGSNGYNRLIVDEATWQARIMVFDYLDIYGNPKLNSTVTYQRGTDSYVLGALYPITAPSFNLIEEPMRLNQVDYDFWNVTLHLEQDESVSR